MNQSNKSQPKLTLYFRPFLQYFNHWWFRIREINVLLNLIKHQRPDNDKIYSRVKDPFESKYQLLINGRKKVEIKEL